jgi:hypothetical protein
MGRNPDESLFLLTQQILLWIHTQGIELFSITYLQTTLNKPKRRIVDIVSILIACGIIERQYGFKYKVVGLSGFIERRNAIMAQEIEIPKKVNVQVLKTLSIIVLQKFSKYSPNEGYSASHMKTEFRANKYYCFDRRLYDVCNVMAAANILYKKDGKYYRNFE